MEPAHPDLFLRLPHFKTQCLVCPHACVLQEGGAGRCGVRKNQGGSMYLLSYGKAAAVHVDPIEKKPLNAFLPGTLTWSVAAPGCNLRCPWCQNHFLLNPTLCDTAPDLRPEQAALEAVANGVPSVSFTYSEPTVSLEYVLSFFRESRNLGLKTVLVTNGYLTRNAAEWIAPWMDAANVDVKAFADFQYEWTGGHLEPVMETIRTWQRSGIHVETTSLLIPGVNDDTHTFRGFCKRVVREWDPMTVWHFSAFRPAFKMMDRGPTPWSLLENFGGIARDSGFKNIILGNRGLAA